MSLQCALQESNPSDGLAILQGFLHLTPSIHRSQYPADFVQYQLELLKRSRPASTSALLELLTQLVPRADVLSSLNSIRQALVESWLEQFRKDTQKQKWGGNGDKIRALATLIDRSLELFATNEHVIKNAEAAWHSLAFRLIEPLLNELSDYLKSKVDKQQQYSSVAHLLEPLAALCEQLNHVAEKNVTSTHSSAQRSVFIFQEILTIEDCFSNIVVAQLHQRIGIHLFYLLSCISNIKAFRLDFQQKNVRAFPSVAETR